MRSRVISNILGLIGAVIGGIAGVFVFRWLLGQGLYGLMIPGALVGLGCSQLSLHRSVPRGVVCGLGAIGLALFCEWKHFPFVDNKEFGYFLGHLNDLKVPTQLMVVLGGVFAFWFAKDSSPWLGRLLPHPAPAAREGTKVEPPAE
ncbi:hypothetical protein [Singulisphaera sp. PoT]|uniref:hypothetical protein n=1 Tax=Singulisphaera sp. PoT TaxID=3411797 RepID=UPI003BF5CFAF